MELFFPNSLAGESMAKPGHPPTPMVSTGEHAFPTPVDIILQPKAYDLITLIWTCMLFVSIELLGSRNQLNDFP